MAETVKRPRPIRRPSRLGAVWLTYRTRWFLWLLLACAIVSFVIAAGNLWPEKSHVIGPDFTPVKAMTSAVSNAPNPAPQANVTLKDGGVVHGKEPEWDKLRSLTLYSGLASCRHLWTPGAMPRLEHLTLFENPHDHQIAKLCELYDLKSLVVTSAGNLTDVAMESLATEPRLQHLHLDTLQPTAPFVVPGELPETVEQREANRHRLIHNAASLKWPTSLQTLFFGDVVGTPQVRFEEWQRLPQLKTLITRIAPIEGSRFPEETIETLRRFPRLQRFYLREYGDTELELSVELQRLLPRVSVRPVMCDPTRGRRAALVMGGGLLLIVLLAMQMSAQFVTPASVLIPYFAAWHLRFSLGIAASLFVASFIALRVAGCSWFVCLTLCGMSILMLALPTKLLRKSMGSAFPGFTNFGFLMPSLVFPLIGMQFLANIYGAEFDWFLRGQHPWIALGLLVAVIWAAFDLVTWHLELPRLLESAGCANVPLGMFDAGWADWGRSIAAKYERKGNKVPYAMRSRDAELDRFAESLHEHKRPTSLALWRLANVQSTIKFVWVFTLVFIPSSLLGAGAVSISGDIFDCGDPQAVLRIAAPVTGQLLMMLVLFPFVFAWQRRPMLAIELLRPVDRRDWINTWFLGIACELTPAMLAASIILVAAWKLNVFDDWPLLAKALFVAEGLAIAPLLAGIGLWAMTEFSLWKTILGSAGFVIVATATIFIPIFLMPIDFANEPLRNADPLVLTLAVAATYFIAYIALRLAWSSWQKFEVGRIV